MNNRYDFMNILNLEILDEFLHYFQKVTNLYSTFFDLKGDHITAPKGDRPYCLLLKNTPFGKECEKNNRVGCRRVKEENKTVIQPCSAGLIDIFIPIQINDELIGIIVTGQIRKKNKNCIQIRKLLQKKIKNNRLLLKLEKRYNKVPLLNEKEIAYRSHLLYKIVDYTVNTSVEQFKLKDKCTLLKNKEIIAICKKKIEEEYTKEICIAKLAKEIGYNKSYLERLFKKHTGMTIIKFVTETRIEKAKWLLRYSANDITYVAFQVGYHDSSYFSKKFKEITGMRPKEYKNKFKETRVSA